MAPTLLNLQLTIPNSMILPKFLFAPLRGLRSLQVKSHLVNRPLFQSLFQDAGEWSDLEVLKLELHATQSATSFLHVADLVTLPLLCTSFPKLHTLQIYLRHPDTDAAGIEALLRSQMHTMGPTKHGLVNLNILFLDPSTLLPFEIRDITLAITTSRFFNHFFPNIQHLDMSHHWQSPAYFTWNDWYHAVVELTMNSNKRLTQ
jgi:hypothetical protein